MRVLIVKTSSLGDIIHALPVIGYLKQACPGVEIDWVVEEAFLPLLKHNPLLRRVHVVRTKQWRTAPFSERTRSELKQLKQSLREAGYAIAFDIQGNLKSGLITWLSGAKERIGFSRDTVQEGLNSLFTTRKVRYLDTDRRAPDRYLRIVSAPFTLDPAGIEHPPALHTTEDDDAYAAGLVARFSNGPLILFHNGTTWGTKLWNVPNWIALAHEVVTRLPGTNILLSWGDETERERALQIQAAVGGTVHVLERLPLIRFIALLKKVDLVVGGDTGPIHLAAAVGTPTVSFYRCTDGSLNGPNGVMHRIVQSPLPCTKCLKKGCDRDAECSASITVRAMLDGVMALHAMKSRKD